MSTGDYMTGWLRSELSGAACYGHPIEIVGRDYYPPEGRRRLRICVETIDADTEADEVALTFDPRHSVEEGATETPKTLDATMSEVLERLEKLEYRTTTLDLNFTSLRGQFRHLAAQADD